MKLGKTLLASLLLVTAISSAQTNDPTVPLPASILSGGINLRSAAGAAFSADVVTQSSQTMSDGATVRQEIHGKMFRDSAGRMRSETEQASPVAGVAPKRYVTIYDPAQQRSIVLDVGAMTARVFPLPSAPAVSSRQLKLAAAATRRETIGSRSLAAPEDLGAMTMEGFLVTGSRRTHAGAVKDKSQPLVTESWFSTELKVELLVTTQVSSSLVRTTRLMNLVQGEPDPQLFQIPAGYSVLDNSQQK